MKDDYKTIIVSYLVMLGFMIVVYLVLDLFKDGVFVAGAITTLIVVGILIAITLFIKAFTLNYKITRRN